MARLAGLCFAINPFRVALHANFKRSADEHFDKSCELLPCSIPITLTVCCGIEDDRDSVFGEHLADEGERTIEIFSIAFVIMWFGREQLSQYVRLQDGDVD